MLREFDWSDLVKGGFFQGQIAGIVTAAGGQILLPGLGLPPWVLVDPWLSAACIWLAFIRVWKTSREEVETMAVWERAAQGENRAIRDRIVEIPYVFLVLALPLSAVLPQLFLLTLAFFYLIDNYYNRELARISAGDDRLARYFGTRSRYNDALAATLVASFLVVTALAAAGRRDAAWLIALVVLVAVIALEWVIEPRRNRGMTFEAGGDGKVLLPIRVDDVVVSAAVPPATRRALEAMHTAAFGPAERQYSMAEILRRAGSPSGILRVIVLDERPVGYVFLELGTSAKSAFLWYVAVDEEQRGRGVGRFAINDTLDMLRREHPDLRYAFFEVHRPDQQTGGESDVDRQRLDFYRRLGAYRVSGVEYQIPAADDEGRSVAYEPMFFTLRDGFDTDEVQAAIRLMAADNFAHRPDDPRWVVLQQSIARARILAPDERLDDGAE